MGLGDGGAAVGARGDERRHAGGVGRVGVDGSPRRRGGERPPHEWPPAAARHSGVYPLFVASVASARARSSTPTASAWPAFAAVLSAVEPSSAAASMEGVCSRELVDRSRVAAVRRDVELRLHGAAPRRRPVGVGAAAAERRHRAARAARARLVERRRPVRRRQRVGLRAAPEQRLDGGGVADAVAVGGAGDDGVHERRVAVAAGDCVVDAREAEGVLARVGAVVAALEGEERRVHLLRLREDERGHAAPAELVEQERLALLAHALRQRAANSARGLGWMICHGAADELCKPARVRRVVARRRRRRRSAQTAAGSERGAATA